MNIFKITEPYIELNRLLKVMNLSESGGRANQMIEAGEVIVNGNVEFRKRNKLKPGDVVTVNDIKISIEAEITAPQP